MTYQDIKEPTTEDEPLSQVHMTSPHLTIVWKHCQLVANSTCAN